MPQCDWGGNGQRSEEVVNINKKHFLMIGSSFGIPRFFFGSSLVFCREGIREVQRKGILRKSTFCASAGGVAFERRGDGSVATVVARMASGKKVRICKIAAPIVRLFCIFSRVSAFLEDYSLSQLVVSMRRYER